MIRHNIRYVALAGMLAIAAHANAGTGTVSPALAACSKALVETISRTEELPAYTVRSPNPFASEMVDKNSFTVFAHNVKTKELLAKASCKATPDGQIVSFKSIPIK